MTRAVILSLTIGATLIAAVLIGVVLWWILGLSISRIFKADQLKRLLG